MRYKTYSFSQFITDEKIDEIAIPMIQRDYAQGRDNPNAKKVREKLLDDINRDKPIKLDFVYGYIEKRDNRKIFIPLDGQQRLTTLFLLHWYVAAETNDNDENIKNNLNKFRYETRTSSSDFTQVLVNSIGSLIIPTLLSEENKKNNTNPIALRETIKNSAWFFNSWEKDPTVDAMLVMLDAIHQRNITQGKLDKITFDFINMADFKLGDDLYLKMNARGVQLTPFENLKSFFEKHLDDVDDSLKKRFAESIDGKWLDSFWDLKYIEEDVIDKSYRTIDKTFMRFFWYMTEMLYFKTGKGTSDKVKFLSSNYNIDSLNEELIKTVYSKEDEVDFLFKTLDNFEEINVLCNNVLSSNYDAGKVALFTTESDLLGKLAKKGQLDNTERLILFSIINYVHEDLDKKPPESHLHDLVRVIRNLLKKGFNFKYDIGKERFYKSISVINYLTEKLKTTNSNSIYHILKTLNDDQKLSTYHDHLNDNQRKYIQDERNKSLLISNNPNLREIIFKLEDDPRIKGATYNFILEDDLNGVSEKLENRIAIFYKIWSGKWSNIVRGFLAVDNYRVWKGTSNLGGKFFLGKEGKDKSWILILTQDKNNKFLINFLEKYNATSSFEKITSTYLAQESPTKTWRYYFVKYPEMTCDEGYRNIFIFEYHDNQSGFKIQDFKTGDRLSERNLRISPYVRAVIGKLKEKHGDVFIKRYIDKSKTEKGGYEANPLWLQDGIKLFCEENGWKLEIDNNESAYKDMSLIDCWCITMLPNVYVEDDKVLLKPTEDKDMIEIAVEFISELYSIS